MLAKQDAFMYHSIPAGHRAKLLLSLSSCQHSEMMIPPCASSRNNTNTTTTTTMISRKSRVSTECDSISLLRQDIMIDNDDNDIEQEVNSIISRSLILEDGFLEFTTDTDSNNNMPRGDPTSVLDFDSKFGCSDVSEFDLMDFSSLLD